MKSERSWGRLGMRFETHPISELIDEISMGPFGSNIKVECFVDKGIPVLNGSNLEGYELKEDSFRYVTKEKADSLNKANAYRGDIVITHRGTLGQIVFIPQTSKYDRYVISQSQFRVRCNHMILPEYMVYYFHTRLGKHKLLSNASQVGVPALARPSTTFQKIEIEIPDIPTQKRIIAILQTIHDKIAINTKINENLEQQAQAVFKSWFVDFEPFGGVMPDDWKECTLNSICDLIIKGITPKYTENSDQLVINQKCVRNHQIDLSLARPHIPKKINEKWLKYGDVLVNSTGTGTLGRAAQVLFIPNNLTVDSHVSIIRASKEEYVYFLGLWATSHEHDFEMLQTGSTGQTDLPRERLKQMQIVLPTKNILSVFSDVIKPIADIRIQKQQENQRLSLLRDSLLPKLMNGEIDVSQIKN